MEKQYKKFTDKERAAFVDRIEARARERHKQLGKEFSAADFFAGAMAANEARGFEWAIPRWVFGIMRGEEFWKKKAERV